MSTFSISNKNRIQRLPARGSYETAAVYAILDEALWCSVGLIEEGYPVVIPALHARRDHQLLIHGASTSRLLQHIQAGHAISVNVTLVDGLVVAKTVFNQSVNYRSVVLYGTGRLIDNDDEKLAALQHLTERLLPGVWEGARPPNAVELKATAIVALDIETASAKTRAGGPKDDADDQQRPTWAGVLPLQVTTGTPIPAAYTDTTSPLPDFVTRFMERHQPPHQ